MFKGRTRPSARKQLVSWLMFVAVVVGGWNVATAWDYHRRCVVQKQDSATCHRDRDAP